MYYASHIGKVVHTLYEYRACVLRTTGELCLRIPGNIVNGTVHGTKMINNPNATI